MPVLMSSPIAKAQSLLTAWQRYGNPWSLWLARHLKPHGKLKIIDRVSRVCCKCTTASSWMFGETWHRHDYDVPKVPVRPVTLSWMLAPTKGSSPVTLLTVAPAFMPLSRSRKVSTPCWKTSGQTDSKRTLSPEPGRSPGKMELPISSTLTGWEAE
jgi:hypothetical protein